MELKVTEVAVEDGVGVLTLSREKRNNAWTGRMHTEYRHGLAALEADPAVGAIVVTGKGRAFCVGADSAALQGHAERGGYDPGTPQQLAMPGFGTDARFDASFAYHFGLSKPILAAINGAAAGVGLVLACYTDLRFAAAGANFSTAHGKLNLPAEYGLSWLLPRMIGLTRANELLLSSRKFSAEEALQMGLVNGVHPSEQVLTATVDYARRLIETVSPNSLRQTRWQIYRDLHRDVATSVTEAEEMLQKMMREPDYAEGVDAFLNRRAPRWGGRVD